MYRSISRMETPLFYRFLEKPKISSLDEQISNKVFELLEVSPEEDSNLRIFDQIPEDSLILIHYLEPTETCKHIRGIVIDVENEKIVAKSFPYTDDILITDKEQLSTISLKDNYEVTKACEGTILRIFQGKISKKWYISTHRKINGRRSRWSGPTFGEMFDSIWGEEDFSKYFESGYCYIFLLSHIENRLVCKVPETRLIHVQTYQERDSNLSISSFCKKNHPNVKSKEVLELGNNLEDLTKFASNLDWREYSGILITTYTEENGYRTIDNCWKLVTPEYYERRGIRGNEPNLKLRYLQLRQNDDEDADVSSIRKLFPEKEELFNTVESQLKELPAFLENYYIERYREGNFMILPKETHILLENTRLNFNFQLSIKENLQNHLKVSKGRYLNAMIRFMLQEKSEENL